jgi:hypothetical protein
MTSDWTTQQRALIRWAALLVPVAGAAVLTLVRGGVNSSTAAMLLVLAVVAAAATGDRVAGVIAALSAAGSFDFFLTEPYYSFSIHQREDLELAVVLVVVGLAVTEIALWGRRQQSAALRRAGYIQGLAELLDLPAGTSADSHARAIAQAISNTLGADGTQWVPGPPTSGDAVVDPDGSVRAGGATLPADRVGLPTEGYTALPVRRSGHVLGHFRVTASTRVVRPTAEQLRVALLLADRMATVREGADSAGSQDPR